MKEILKLSIILPDTPLPKQSMDLIDWCLANQQVELVCLIWTSKKNRKYIHTIEDVTWSALLFLESLYLKIKKITKKEALKEIKKFAQPQEFTLRHNNESYITQINSLEIDLHLALNPDASIPRLKDSSRLGVLCFNNENNLSDQKKPYFFSEVLNKQDKTIFSILQYQPSNELPIVLQQGAFPTHGYFLANQENVLLRQNFYMQKEIEEILQNNFDSSEPFKGVVHNDLPSAPSIANQFKYLFHLFALATKRLGGLFKQVDRWNVGFYLGDWKSLDFKNSICIENPKNHFLADPFVIEESHKNYCFVEDYDIKKSKGSICVYEISNNEVINIGVALEESFHLSFPYLFKHDLKIYMLPETNENNDIRLYESIEFPLQWRLARIIKSNVQAVDSMIFQHNKLWWLFSNINPIGARDTCSELSLFYADDPISGEWTPHKHNPVIFDPSSARNGGIVFDNNSVYRVGQKQVFGTYGGGGFSVNKIIELTPDTYREEPALIIEPNFFTNLKGSHHFHSNGAISVFDFLT
jgi:hypothetical protein